MNAKTIGQVKRLVIKIGSGVLTDQKGLHLPFFKKLAVQVSCLHELGKEIVIVSSGAIACGMDHLGLKKRPDNLWQKQAVAAIGQPKLMNLYAKVFSKHKITTAQILLTRSDVENRGRFLNAKHALCELLRGNVVPVINENDSVAVEEIKVGDNDQLSAMVAHLSEAPLLVILTDTDGFFEKDPKLFPSAKRIPVVANVDDTVLGFAKDTKSPKSTGGMITKLKAASYASRHGIATWIVNGHKRNILLSIVDAKNVGTLFLPK